MAWSTSEMFRSFLGDVMTATEVFDLSGAGVNAFKVALYNNTITPLQDAASASTAYNTGAWATAQECYEAGQWAQTGVALSTPAIDQGTAGIVFWDGVDTASGSAADLTNATGALVYDDTVSTPVADQGVCYNYFGGPNSVVNGTFTVIWNTLGIWRATL